MLEIPVYQTDVLKLLVLSDLQSSPQEVSWRIMTDEGDQLCVDSMDRCIECCSRLGASGTHTNQYSL